MNTHQKQNYGSFLHDSGTGQCETGHIDVRMWMKSQQKDKYITMMTNCFQHVNADWKQDDSRRFVNAVEHLLFHDIDTSLLLKKQVNDEGVVFQFHLVENIRSDELLDMLMEYHPGKWQFIQDAFLEDGNVDLVYEDRYVSSPLGCLLLAQFIRRLKGMFALSFHSIRIVVSKSDFHVMFDDDTLKIDRRFSHAESRDRFLRQCMDEIVGVPYKLEVKNTKHFRSLTLCNSRFRLSIHPDGGISHGWGIENGEYSHLTINVLKQHLDTNIPCFNRAAHEYDRRGIPYVVSFSLIKNEVK